MKTPPELLFGLLFAACAAAATLPARAEPSGAALAYSVFDANHCLTGIRPLPEEGTVEFIWGCAAKNIITIACVFDRTGYPGLGPRFARPGWHCNHPLPVLEDEKGDRSATWRWVIQAAVPSGLPAPSRTWENSRRASSLTTTPPAIAP